MHRLPYIALVSFALLLSSCGGSGSSTDDPTSPSSAARRVVFEDNQHGCPYGGVLVQTGIDENRNGTLDDDEVDASEAVCNGAPGADGTPGDDGLPSLLKRTVLEPGDDDNCPAGGEFIESGIDDDGNGTLEAGEVDDSAYLCTSPASLLKRTVLIAGDDNCPAGGEFVESGSDDNGSGTLEASEVDDSAYLCHSLALLYAEKTSSLPLRLKACRLGGTEGQFGIDTNGDGTLEAEEVNAAIPIDCDDTNVGQVLADEATTDRWSARQGHSSVVFDGKLWVIGGSDGSASYFNEVWSSSDGVTWEEAAIPDGESRWSARNNHTSVVFNNSMWVLGGSDGTNRLGDVWSSPDGASWTQVTTSSTSWSARTSHSSVVFNNSMWVLGGFDGSDSNEVWSSPDGATWTKAAASGHWSARNNHTSVVFNNSMWVLGGRAGSDYLDEVWSSSDGASWAKAAASGHWSGRRYHSSVVFDGRMWVIGGFNNSYLDDVWSSSDGASWTDETPSDTHWSARSGHSSAAFDGYLWVLGGEVGSNTYHNDVWVFAP